MSRVVELLPGLIGAIAAFVALLILGWLDVQSTWIWLVVFLLVYAGTTISFDRAITAYGKRR